MESLDLTTVIVLGALIGLFFVAVGYGQIVWLSRQQHAREASTGRRATPFVTWTVWVLGAGSLFLLLRALTSSTLPLREGFLVGENLVSVRARPGLVARFESNNVEVRRGDLLLRFSGQDGEDAAIALRSRRAVLENELEIERTRPLELDPDLLRTVDTARATLRDAQSRLKQAVSERDAIAREMNQQRLTLDNQRLRIEQDDRVAARELPPLRATRETEGSALHSQDQLLKDGLVSKFEAARARDAVTGIDGRIGQLEDQRSILERARKDVDRLSATSQTTYARQLSARNEEIASTTAELEAARKAVELASAALEQDRPRAEARREKRLRQIDVQIGECDAMLGDRARQLIVEAPFDGRVGFREPSPASTPADNGPLLVLYRPGAITAAIKLAPDETDIYDSALSAQVKFSPAVAMAAEALGKELTLPGAIVQRNLLPGGGELRIACDPPDRVVRQLALGGSVPVKVQLRQRVTTTSSFRAGLLVAAAAVAVALYNAWRRRRPATAAAQPPAAGAAPAASTPIGPTPGGPQPVYAAMPTGPAAPMSADALAAALATYEMVRQQLARRIHIAPTAPADDAGDRPAPAEGPRPLLALASPPPNEAADAADAAAPAPPADPPPQPTPRQPTPLHGLEVDLLRQLGAQLRAEVNGLCLTPALIHQLTEALGRGGYAAAAIVSSGYGPVVDERAVERAAFQLLSGSSDETDETDEADETGEAQIAEADTDTDGTLSGAARDCAEFIRIMRTIGPGWMSEALDRLRLALVAAALDAAKREGASSQWAGSAVAPLMGA